VLVGPRHSRQRNTSGEDQPTAPTQNLPVHLTLCPLDKVDISLRLRSLGVRHKITNAPHPMSLSSQASSPFAISS
jgi:hypothetical protein